MQKVKMIWDFRGPNAAPISEHHRIHLDEFVVQEKLENIITGTETSSEMHQITYMIVPFDLVETLRMTLKPHRGQLYNE